ncbi:sugar transferase [Rhodobacteraceae bacterium KN286]|uniref:Sugar transferase n=1 Tax=Oceanomicrobium pacificus TaxID=2692916 RepID=A0A6B0TMX7_9RHOB|nr:sugar transferase [Oceanomicrobium pacificus]
MLIVLVGVIVLAIPMLVTAAYVFVSLGRPLLFAQTRAGRAARPFKIRKFRTMSDARDVDGALLPDADRVTAASNLLRRSRLDELPQIFAILFGHMALVGPRPLLPETIAEFGADGVYRCAVRPGMTGWAQVSGNTFLSNSEKLQLDLWYVANRSFLLDLRIILETVAVLIFGERRREDRIAAATVARAELARQSTAGQGGAKRVCAT